MSDKPPTRNPKMISVVFSFRNEAEVLPELIRRTRDVLQKEEKAGVIAGHELIFVNDSSADRSQAILLEHAQNHQDIRILTTSRPFGVSPCALAGLEYASGDAVIYMDADLQDPPEVIPELIRAWQEGPDIDVVHTVRKSRAGESWIKIFLTRIGYWTLNRLMDFKLPIEAGDFKLLSRRVVDELIQMKENKPFLRGLVCWVGFKQTFVYYERQPRRLGKTKFPVLSRGVIGNFLNSAVISFSSLPLKLALGAGVVTTVASLGLFFYKLLALAGLPPLPQEFSALVVGIVFLGGLQLMAIGILGLYIHSIFLETKGRPNYILKETFGFPKHS